MSQTIGRIELYREASKGEMGQLHRVLSEEMFMRLVFC